MFTSTTREELEAEAHERLSPGDLAMVDQRDAVLWDVMRRTRNNNRIMFRKDGSESKIGEAVREITQGRVPEVHELFAWQQMQVLPPLRLRMYGYSTSGLTCTITLADPFQPNMNVGQACMSCNKKQHDERLRYLDIGVGRILIEFGFCGPCAMAIHLGWGPLDWSETGATV